MLNFAIETARKAGQILLDKLGKITVSKILSNRPIIFISYARDDDEAFANKLWCELEKHNINVWWDRKAMESRGATFLQEIRDAIASVDRVLLIVGLRAKATPYVEVEWCHALRAGVVVTPLLRLGNYSDVPEALRSLTARTYV